MTWAHKWRAKNSVGYLSNAYFGRTADKGRLWLLMDRSRMTQTGHSRNHFNDCTTHAPATRLQLHMLALVMLS